MKDIDFDELDRAVNSLMAPANDTTPTASPAPAPQSPQPAATPVAPVPQETAPQQSADRPAAVTPAARRGGRFMDMVHSSSDMKGRSTTAPSREGISIPAPRSAESATVVAATPTEPTEQLDSTLDASLTTPMPVSDSVTTSGTPTAEPTIDSLTMPDPIDMDAAKQKVDDDSTVNEATTTDNLPSEEQVDDAQGQASESPFLADAKVEKRPLNPEPLAPAAPPLVDLEAELSEDQPEEAVAGDTDEVANADGKDEPPVVPEVPELNSELVAIEAGERTEETSASIDENEEDSAKEAVNEHKGPVGPASISQQYKTVESTGDKSHAAIYDATQYPEPVAHPAKKKSGWLWIVWVLVLLALGAGGAVALYVMGII